MASIESVILTLFSLEIELSEDYTKTCHVSALDHGSCDQKALLSFVRTRRHCNGIGLRMEKTAVSGDGLVIPESVKK